MLGSRSWGQCQACETQGQTSSKMGIHVRADLRPH
jgi:hypothetical protein